MLEQIFASGIVGVNTKPNGTLVKRLPINRLPGELSMTLSTFLRLVAVICRGCFIAMTLRACPATFNDLEQMFGTVRHHQRRCTGRKAYFLDKRTSGDFTINCFYGFVPYLPIVNPLVQLTVDHTRVCRWALFLCSRTNFWSCCIIKAD